MQVSGWEYYLVREQAEKQLCFSEKHRQHRKPTLLYLCSRTGVCACVRVCARVRVFFISTARGYGNG